jgi:hypothetical protein
MIVFQNSLSAPHRRFQQIRQYPEEPNLEMPTPKTARHSESNGSRG